MAVPAAAPWYAKALVAVLKSVAANVALSKVSRALTPKKKPGAQPLRRTVRTTTEYRRILLGKRRLWGAFAFYGNSNQGAASDGRYLYYVIVYAAHQCNSIIAFRLDNREVLASAINGTTGEVSGWNGKLYIWPFLGTQAQGANTDLDANVSAWSTTHRLRGNMGAVLRFERSDTEYPNGPPNDVSIIAEGALLYDPRKDDTNGGSGTHRRDNPSTWEYGTIGDNPVLQARWWITGGSVVNDQATRLVKYGLRELDARIPDAAFAAAANVCDESVTIPEGSQKRYRCNLEVSCGQARREVLEQILATMMGAPVYMHGKLYVYAGKYDAPAHDLTQDDLYFGIDGNEEFDVDDTTDWDGRYNSASATFIDGSTNDFVEATTGIFKNAGYVTQDGGHEIHREFDLRGVTDRRQAERICIIKLRQSRNMRNLSMPLSLKHLKIAPYETFNYLSSRLGWSSNRVFRCFERSIDTGRDLLKLGIRVETSATWTDPSTGEYGSAGGAAGGSETDTLPEPVDPRTVGQDDQILFMWDPPAFFPPGLRYQPQWSLNSDMSSPTTLPTTGDTQVILPRTNTDTVYFRVRSVLGPQVSSWVPVTGGIPGTPTSASNALQATVTPGTRFAQGPNSTVTTGTVTVTATGGTPPYSYTWTRTSGSTKVNATAPSSNVTAFQGTSLDPDELASAIFGCEIEDDVGATFGVGVSASVLRNSGS